MRSLTLLLALVLTSGALVVAADDLPALPPPPPLPADAGGVPDLPALPNNDAALPALPPAPAAPAKADKAPASTGFDALPALPTPPAAPAATTATNAPSATAESPAALPSEGVAGVITGGRVNVRAGDSTKYEIVYTADPETPVTVYEKKGEWVKIGFPEKEFCYVEQRAVEGDIPADIPEQGIGRTIRNDGAKVYVRPWAGSTVVGSVKAGESVVVTGARGQFLRIRPPATAYAWVFEKFIRYNGEGVQTVELTEEEKAARAKANEEALRDTVNDLKSGKGKLMSAREANPLLLKLRERTQVERKQREAQREAVKSMVANIDKQMELIDAETAARIADIDRNRVDMARVNEEAMRAAEEGYRPGPPPGSMGNSATGWIEHVAFWRGRPAEYRLVKGQEIICYIRSNRYNLADYNGRRVVVTGNLVKSPNGKVDVLSVDTLRLFEQSRVETPVSSLPPVAQEPLRPAPAPQTFDGDGTNSVRVIRESTVTPGYSSYSETTTTTTTTIRPLDRSQHVVTFRDDPVRLEQNEDIVIIEDTPGSASQLRVGQRVDVTGMPTP